MRSDSTENAEDIARPDPEAAGGEAVVDDGIDAEDDDLDDLDDLDFDLEEVEDKIAPLALA
ncbi:ammosamide/lymphostin RiPP family protein [Actinomadura decatromicini]|uniref:Ammosamide/lymphostin RiPP family protein n=1 Tax=Actinomadura decatromicini TaxID=2604572 RepID=A0A5D3FRJ6_9ACTN|nr:ammosamide/lymphostin RiPP family protein [Actinomadura decatromicini]